MLHNANHVLIHPAIGPVKPVIASIGFNSALTTNGPTRTISVALKLGTFMNRIVALSPNRAKPRIPRLVVNLATHRPFQRNSQFATCNSSAMPRPTPALTLFQAAAAPTTLEVSAVTQVRHCCTPIPMSALETPLVARRLVMRFPVMVALRIQTVSTTNSMAMSTALLAFASASLQMERVASTRSVYMATIAMPLLSVSLK